MFGHRMIFHGRQVCHARKPRCEECALAKLCPEGRREATTKRHECTRLTARETGTQ